MSRAEVAPSVIGPHHLDSEFCDVGQAVGRCRDQTLLRRYGSRRIDRDGRRRPISVTAATVAPKSKKGGPEPFIASDASPHTANMGYSGRCEVWASVSRSAGLRRAA